MPPLAPGRLKMFRALVTSSILWSLAVLSPTASHLRALHVQHVTLTGWMLRCAPHFSWRDPACIPCARHGVKLWIRCYSKLWNQVLLEQQWKWVGHVLRMPPTSVVRQTLLQLHPTSRDGGQRRARTGPNNAGHRVLLRWLLSQQVDFSDRLAWEELEGKWVDRLCARHQHNDVNLWMIPSTEHLPQDYCAIQGSFQGQQVFVVGFTSNGQWFMAELDRAHGWRHLTMTSTCDFPHFVLALEHCVRTWCRRSTFHCRFLIFSLSSVDLSFLSTALPYFSDFIHTMSLVCEISKVPDLWLARLNPDMEYLLGLLSSG